MSSANFIDVVDGSLLFMSFTYIKNSIGPIIEPWDTPSFMSIQSDMVPLMSTHCCFPDT